MTGPFVSPIQSDYMLPLQCIQESFTFTHSPSTNVTKSWADSLLYAGTCLTNHDGPGHKMYF